MLDIACRLAQKEVPNHAVLTRLFCTMLYYPRLYYSWSCKLYYYLHLTQICIYIYRYNVATHMHIYIYMYRYEHGYVYMLCYVYKPHARSLLSARTRYSGLLCYCKAPHPPGACLLVHHVRVFARISRDWHQYQSNDIKALITRRMRPPYQNVLGQYSIVSHKQISYDVV